MNSSYQQSKVWAHVSKADVEAFKQAQLKEIFYFYSISVTQQILDLRLTFCLVLDATNFEL